MAEAPVDPADRARVRTNRHLLEAYERAYAAPDARAALLRADDPEREHDGAPSPFLGLEHLRRRVFSRSATEADRRDFERIRQQQAEELARVDAAVRVAITDAERTAPARPTARAATPAASTSSPVRRRLAVAGAVIATVAVLVALTVMYLAASARADLARLAVPPPLPGRTVVTLTDLAGQQQPDTGTVFWNSGEQPLPPPGGAVRVALRCRGVGSVEVRLSSGERWTYACTATERVFTALSDHEHADPLFVFVPTTGRVMWSLRVSTTPVGDGSATG